MNALNENLVKAQQGMNLVVSDLRSAHRAAIRENQFAEILLLDLIGEAVALENKLKQMAQASAIESAS
jgi:hypothetical protein